MYCCSQLHVCAAVCWSVSLTSLVTHTGEGRLPQRRLHDWRGPGPQLHAQQKDQKRSAGAVQLHPGWVASLSLCLPLAPVSVLLLLHVYLNIDFFFFHHLFARLPRWKKWWERRRRRATPSTCALGTTRYTASGAWRNASRGWRSWRTPGVATRRRSSESHPSVHRSVSSKRAVKHQITVPEIVFFTFITTSPVGCQFIITSLSLMVTALFTVVSLSMSNNRYCFTLMGLMGNHCLIALVSLVFFWEFYLGFNK